MNSSIQKQLRKDEKDQYLISEIAAARKRQQGDCPRRGQQPALDQNAFEEVESMVPAGPGGDFILKDSGVYKVTNDGTEKKICSKLDVVAKVRSSDSVGWGLLLEWSDPDNKVHRWACPLELLAGDGLDFRKFLMSHGLVITPGRKAAQALQLYVQTFCTNERIYCVDQAGWHDRAYVLPGCVISNDKLSEGFILQANGVPQQLRQSGTVKDWRDKVGKFCMGNSRLILAASIAFASPLVSIAGDESGGIHLVGKSSCGKSTAQRVAVSIWSDPSFKVTWRATSNGLEAIAASRNDGLLVLDEIGQASARETGSTVYMLGNGEGKQRSSRSGFARKAVKWRLLILSSGEVGLATHISADGQRVRAGQENRLCDVPANQKFGIFDELHGFANGAEIADYLNKESAACYGTPIRTYLQHLVEMDTKLLSVFIQQKKADFIRKNVPADADGQVRRVAARFALIAAGGEMASRLAITGWQAGDAIDAASKCFQSWIALRGGTKSQEESQALSTVRYYIEKHGDDRFSLWNGKVVDKVINRAGYWRRNRGKKEYLITSEVFKKDICAGLDPIRTAKILRDNGCLVTNESDRLTIKLGRKRFYCVTDDLLAGE